MVEICANSGDHDQMLHSVASDLGLHCLPITLLGVSRLLRGMLHCKISIFNFTVLNTESLSLGIFCW